MPANKPQLQRALSLLEKHKAQWRLEYPDPRVFWPAYKAAAETILEAAGPRDREWVQMRIWELMEGH